MVSEARNTGTIVSVSDGIIRIHGLSDVMQGEMIALLQATVTQWHLTLNVILLVR